MEEVEGMAVPVAREEMLSVAVAAAKAVVADIQEIVVDEFIFRCAPFDELTSDVT